MQFAVTSQALLVINASAEGRKLLSLPFLRLPRLIQVSFLVISVTRVSAVREA